ncbi:type II toxin-antitoxin system YhaV family toxin [Sphaerospermopsis torques-reginae ITEP-024]|uniref:Type II toxin-antitoxin system YhaV family toxin n=1 Tax=Sphaerospermopsis torques-reginae ITEP-024 TaxID=984208 RepID=A0ABX8X6I8_9CYAN|nr:type II toxin-antitoxin system YhaV family toxin [Sphaerospermopsis torques-reginae ITEP-024]
MINGWTIFAHSLFLEQLEELIIQVENLRQKYPQEYKQKNATKRLAAIFKLAFNVIPQDPTLNDYRQGITLGDEYKHWFRAKFFQQYRLFFRYHQHGKIIVYAWVNEEKSKRAFQKMLESGNPPDEWNDLLKEAESETNRLEQVFKTEI